ncbi:hypothetical protein SAMN04488128_1011743 [Chitinophaga eiseniae]|uniref:Ig-like domain-containing protein n=1 Tax=Chitinophaga eiseniae TaxID=634771 RepID=A0A1T4NTH3_9BACT|nr:hypothetical protein [Chitinophaga eiseniae]SJZ82533.1 hypothetical protein SAMN04488128_1011743 [Chitinophaga eiseniae]
MILAVCQPFVSTAQKEGNIWYFGDNYLLPDGRRITVAASIPPACRQDGTTVTRAGDYTVRYTTWRGCDSTFQTKLTVTYPPLIELGPDTCLF